MVEMKNYQDDILYVAHLALPWEKLIGKTVLISGASGMIGSFLIHVLMAKEEGIQIYALGRNAKTAQERFKDYWDDEHFHFLAHDINTPLEEMGPVDFVIHAASNTHPTAYASDPIGTITTNIIGTFHMLNYAAEHSAKRFLFTSSVEVYGESRGETDDFPEDYCGYINCNTLRAGYPESKRAGEALCQAYRKQKNLDAVIGRLSRTYGPTMLNSDTKAISQFIKRGVRREDIILKSAGNQFYSYNYVADAVSGLLTILLKGVDGEAYNIADSNSNIFLKDLANMIADYSGTQVVFELPDQIEAAGYSKATKAILNSDKLRALGWKAHWGMKDGIFHTIDLISHKQADRKE